MTHRVFYFARVPRRRQSVKAAPRPPRCGARELSTVDARLLELERQGICRMIEECFGPAPGAPSGHNL